VALAAGLGRGRLRRVHAALRLLSLLEGLERGVLDLRGDLLRLLGWDRVARALGSGLVVRSIGVLGVLLVGGP
jgi:hypothetical protein